MRIRIKRTGVGAAAARFTAATALAVFGAAGAVGTAWAQEKAGGAPNDAEIAHIAVTANTIDAELARLAESRAGSAEVRAFAATMIADHTAVNGQAAALAERLGVTPQDNEVSRQLQSGAEEAREQLEGLRGGAFDRAYMDREVAYHQAVLDALDQVLIPNASNAELRGLLEQVRPAIAAHLEHARSIRAALGGNGR